jgi:hypothetical protein
LLKAFAFAALLSIVVLGCCVPTIGQGVTAGYTLYVSFFYPFNFLYNLHVTVRDQTGGVVGSGMSPDGSLLTIPIRTEGTTISLSVSVSGYASGPLTDWVVNPNFWPVFGKSTIPVESIGGDYWVTVNISQ